MGGAHGECDVGNPSSKRRMLAVSANESWASRCTLSRRDEGR